MRKKEQKREQIKKITAFILSFILAFSMVYPSKCETVNEQQTVFGTELQTETVSETNTEMNTEMNAETNTEENTEANTETNTEAVTESSTESETMTSSGSIDLVLTESKGQLQLSLTRADQGVFPEGVFLRLRSLHEITAEYENSAEKEEKMQTQLKTAAASALWDWLKASGALSVPSETAVIALEELEQLAEDSVTLFNPMEVSLYAANESLYEAGVLHYEMEEKISSMPELEQIFVFVYDENQNVTIFDRTEYIAQEQLLHAAFSLSEPAAMVTFAALDIDIYQSEWERLISESGNFAESDQIPEADSEFEIGSEKVCETEEKPEAALLADTSFASVVLPGDSCPFSGFYTIATEGEDIFSSKYSFIRGGASSAVEFWYDESLVIRGYREVSGDEYLMPNSDSAKGKFGFRVTNVAYNRENGCKMDLLVTVSDYLNYSYDRNGQKVEQIYPYIGVNKNLKFHFLGSLPDVELTCTMVKSGTTEQLPGNYRFMWTDIDGGQQYGFSAVDGNIDARYCLADCEVNCGTETAFGHTYHTLYAPKDNTDSSNMKRSVMFEISNLSEFRILVKEVNFVTASAELIRADYEDARDGVYNRTAGAMLGWNGSAYGPTEMPYPVRKYVSNDGVNWSETNQLNSVEDTYWYMLEFFVPQESRAYYYSELYLEDQLPEGVQYKGSFSAVTAETGKTKKGFQLTEEQGHIRIDASELISSSSFYGKTYCLKFQVAMNPNELTPKYKDSTAFYEVQNSATLTGKHQNDAAPVTTESNTVKTYAQEYLTGSIVLNKTADTGAMLPGAVFLLTAAEDICARDGTVLVKKGTELERGTTDETGICMFENCYPGTYHLQELLPPSGYTIRTDPISAVVPAADTKGIIADCMVTVINEATEVILEKKSAEEDAVLSRMLEGVTFRIWEESEPDESAQEYITDENGQIVLEGFTPGTYHYQEIETLPGYLLDDTVYSFTIDENGRCGGEHKHKILCTNSYLQIQITKTDQATGNAVSGAHLQLKDSKGKVVEEWISEAVPHRISRIVPGSYTICETQAPSGYQICAPKEIQVKETADIQKFSLENCKYVEIKLTKTIRAEEIVWAHGNPIFTFCVDGTDLDGLQHTYYKSVEFEPLTTADSGFVSLSAVFQVPAGEYRAFETNVIRYKLASIESVQNGTVSGVGVLFDLRNNTSGAAAFVNRKNNDDGLSDTAYIKNIIAAKK